MSKRIEKLTPEQEAKIPEYVERYTKIALNTEPVDPTLSEAAITKTFEFKGKPKPTFKFITSPIVAMKEAAKLKFKKEDVSVDEVKSMAQSASYGSFESYWVGFYAFIAEQLPVESHPLIAISKELVENCGVYWIIETDQGEVVIHTDRPSLISLDATNQLSNEDGLALKYRDGTGIFSLHGVKYESMMDMVVANELKKAQSQDNLESVKNG